MHYEYKNVDSTVHVYEVDGDEQKMVLTMPADDYRLLWPMIEKYSEQLSLPVDKVYLMLLLPDRHICRDCVDCFLWNDEEHHCSLKKPCVKAKLNKWRFLSITETLEAIRYSTPEFIDSLRYLTIDGDSSVRVHTEYFKCLEHLADNEDIVGSVSKMPLEVWMR